jgi:DNA-binding XRE family transcriptional regulator
MRNDWLWDKRISLREAVGILSNAEHPRFIYFAGLLLSRKNTPQEVFQNYLTPKTFCYYWPKIKRAMRQSEWNNPRIEFWQAVYEKLLEKFRIKGVVISPRQRTTMTGGLCSEIGQRLKTMRKQRKLTQKMLSKKLHISQQMISRIESGRENVSLRTLDKIVRVLGGKISVAIN